MVKMSSWTCRIHKSIDFEIFNPGLFYKGDFHAENSLFGSKIPNNPLCKKKPWIKYFKIDDFVYSTCP